MKKIRIRQFFIDFDKLRKGYCTPDQFRRILELAGLPLPDHQFQLLVNKYKRPDDLLDYDTFCENIDRIFTIKGIARAPLVKVPQINKDTTIPARRFYLDMTQDEISKFEYLIGLIKKEIETRRLMLKLHFQDFDTTRNGYVTRSQFLRVLYQFDIFPSEEYLQCLLKAYCDNGNLNEINYYKFCGDVDGQDRYTKNINESHAVRFTQPLQRADIQPYIHSDVQTDLDSVISRLQKKIKEERIRVAEFLRDFDKLRSGGITNQQLRIGLNMAKLQVSNNEFRILTQHFSMPEKEGFVCWRNFCEKLDEVFTVKHLEKFPDSKFGGSILKTVTMREKMPADMRKLAEKVISQFRFYCKATRLYVKQFFKEWDRLGRNKVSSKQFRQVLTTVGFKLSNSESEAICNYFKSDDGYINYVDFINMTTPRDELTEQGLSEAGRRAQANFLNSGGFQLQKQDQTQSMPVQDGHLGPKAPSEPLVSNKGLLVNNQLGISTKAPLYSFIDDLNVDPTRVLERIKRDVGIGRIRLREYLQDFDPLRKGVITVNKFFGSLDKLK